MTKRTSFQSAAALLLFSLITVSCITTDKSLGDNLIPDNYNVNIKIAEVNVPVQMKMSDSLQTIFPGYLLVGAYKDLDLGTTISGAAFQIIPNITDNDFGDNPVPSYIRISMAVTQTLVLNTEEKNVPQNIYLYTLKKDLDSTTAFNNSIKLSDVNPVPINTGGTVFMGGDSIVMNLSLDFAKSLLTATQDERDSSDIFVKRFKGLFMATEPLPGAIQGGRFNIINPSDVYLELKYRHVEAAESIDKDSLLYYYISTSRPYVNSISHSTKNKESVNPTGKIFMEGLAGIKPYIDFAEIKGLFSTWATSQNISLSQVIIAKAELRLPYEFPASYLTMGQFPSQIYLSTREQAATTYKLPLYEPVSDIRVQSTGMNNRSLMYYSLDISGYLQKVFKGTLTGTSLQTWISPIAQETNSYTGDVSYYIDNLVYSKATLNGSNATRKPQIILTYAVMP
ncbi:MAG: DUF4270 family protein [Bacteroidales bacterium]|jgi:hypothetical protein